ncbi:autotransporter assembly complex protein TamA [Marinobacterium arenosum]|uniref:autotransporter assembly complex protein TamA n=1 Tax=Marinobacterium arenosum TaxID=2862496 RepID=UPI001C96AA28|nr:autotransporter assembly complex family protein [Marinobacterium arenosum]MBY4677301.1 autotransporter assembly complex protein TamA [Marinobacterium arenosum]
MIRTAFLLLLLCVLGVGQAVAEPLLRVQVQGLAAPLEQNVRNSLGIVALDGQPVASESRLRYLHRRAKREIGRALEPFGYYRPAVEARLTLQEGEWRANYQIDSGPPLPIGSADLQLLGPGADEPAFASLILDANLKPGQTLVHADYERLKQQLQSAALELGYYQAVFQRRQVRVDLAAYQADIALHFASGPRFRVGEIRFSPTPLNEGLLRRYLQFQPGDPLSNSALLELQGALLDADLFNQVEVRPRWKAAEDLRVPIDVELAMRPRSRYQFGLGYGTDTGARAKAALQRRWVNARGHQFNSQLLISQILTDLSAEYLIPGQRPQFDRYALRTGYRDENSETVDARTLSLGVSRQQQQGEWQRLASLDWEQETFSFEQQHEQTQFLLPRLSWSKISTPDRLNVQQGYRISLQLLAASRALLSETDLLQARLSGKWVHGFGERWRLIARGELGASWVDDFDRVPATLRFFAGGDASVRGYDYQSLGPVSAAGDVIGGQHLLVGSLEADYRLAGAWSVAAFVDQGNAFNDLDVGLKTGVGFGVRWHSPVGPVRVDLATPLDEGGLRLHFTLGPDL